MIKLKIIELINRQLDGELNEKEAAQLKEYLKHDQEAGQFSKEQQQVNTYLNTVPEINQPMDMKDSIMAGINASASPDRHSGKAAVFDSRNWFSRENVRLIISHAAFLMIGFGLSAYLFHMSSRPATIDLNQLLGTIGLHHQRSVISSSAHAIKLKKFQGRVDLEQNLSQAWITFEFPPADKFTTNLIFNPDVLNFRMFMASTSETISLENTKNGLVVRSEGSYLLFFEKLKNIPSDVQIEITNSSQELERLSLTLNNP
jgi:hypothetical protein